MGIIKRVVDDRGIVQRRNDRSGPLQRQTTRRVWVDLSVMYPQRSSPGSRLRACPRTDGVDLTARVPGDLLWWSRTTTGEWVGWCCVQIAAAGDVAHVWSYVPAAALAPREELA